MIRRFTSKLLKYYQLLELNQGATPEEIKAAYNRLVMKYHPDTTSILDKKLAAEKFKAVLEAKTMLLSPPKNETENLYDFKSAQEAYSKKTYKESSYKGYEDFRKYNESKEKPKEDDPSFKNPKHEQRFYKTSKEWSSSKAKPDQDPLPASSFYLAIASFSLGVLYILYHNLKPSVPDNSRNFYTSQNSKTLGSPQKPSPSHSSKPEEAENMLNVPLSVSETLRFDSKKLEYMFKGQSGQHRRFTLLSGDDNDHSVFKCNTCHAVVTKAHMIDHVEYYRLEHLRKSKNSKINSK